MTLNEYKTLVVNSVDDTSARAGSVIEFEIQSAYNFVVNELKHYLIADTDEQIAYLANERIVTMPSEPLVISQAYIKEGTDTDWCLIRPMTPQEYSRKYYRDSREGRPSAYYSKASQLSFNSTPDTGGTLRVIYIPAQNKLSGSVQSVIPDRYTQVIIFKAIAGLLEYEQDASFQVYEQKFNVSFEQMRKDLASKQPNETHPRLKLYGRR